jgi:hypothetical protein
LLVAACVVPSSPIFVTLMKEAPGSSETLVLRRATRRNNPEDTILHSHRRENLKSYISYTSFDIFLQVRLVPQERTVRYPANATSCKIISRFRQLSGINRIWATTFWKMVTDLCMSQKEAATPPSLGERRANDFRMTIGCKRMVLYERSLFEKLTLKTAVFWDVTPHGSCKNRQFGRTYRLHHQSEKNRRSRNNVSNNYQQRNVALLQLVTVNVVSSSTILVTLMMEAIRSSETSLFTRVMRRNAA